MQTDMNQHESKYKNTFFRIKTHSKCIRDVLRGSKRLYFLLFQIGENWVSKRDKSKNGLQRSTVNGQRSTVNGQRFAKVNGQRSTVCKGHKIV